MPNIEVTSYFQALTANGDATGYAVVTDSSGYYVGCLGFLRDDDGDATAKRVIITEIKDSTHVGIRFVANDNEGQQQLQVYGGRSNLTGYTTAKHATLYMDQQLARVEASTAKPAIRNV